MLYTPVVDMTMKKKHSNVSIVFHKVSPISEACSAELVFASAALKFCIQYMDWEFWWALASTRSANQASAFSSKESLWSSYSITNPFWVFCACSKSSRWWHAFCVSATNSSSWPTGLIFWPPACPTWSPGTPKPPGWRSTRSTDCYGEFSLKTFCQS